MLSAIPPPQTTVSGHSLTITCLYLPSTKPTFISFCKSSSSNSSSSSSVVQGPLSSYSNNLHPVSTTPKPGNNHANSNSNDEDRVGGDDMVASATAVAAIIRKVSTSPVEFVQRLEKGGGGDGGFILPSADFQRLCIEQLNLFRGVVHPDALLSVYVRPAGSYVMDQLELRRVTFYPSANTNEIVILVGNFSIPAGLRAAEAALSSKTVEIFPELRSLVFPIVKHPFILGFLVAEIPQSIIGEEVIPSDSKPYILPHRSDPDLLKLREFKAKTAEMFYLKPEQRINAIYISRSLATAYVMDQKTMLLQQSYWQNSIRMNSLVEQIRGSLSSIQTLSKMLSVQMRRSEVSYDIVEDILVQGGSMKDTLQQLQDAVYLTKANIIRYNGGTFKKIDDETQGIQDSLKSKITDNLSLEKSVDMMKESLKSFSRTSTSKDAEMPMPPLALVPLQQDNIRRPCDLSDVLTNLVEAVEPLARMQKRLVKLCELSTPLVVAVDEPSLRQALSNLIEGALLRTQVGGKVEIVSTGAPAGGALVIVDDDGPDMQYMTQMHSLTPFGLDLLGEDKVGDNMAWNFIAGLTVAREILESYGCVVRVISPRISESAIGAGGTRVELWLPFPNLPGSVTSSESRRNPNFSPSKVTSMSIEDKEAILPVTAPKSRRLLIMSAHLKPATITTDGSSATILVPCAAYTDCDVDTREGCPSHCNGCLRDQFGTFCAIVPPPLF